MFWILPIFRNTFFTEHSGATPSALWKRNYFPIMLKTGNLICRAINLFIFCGFIFTHDKLNFFESHIIVRYKELKMASRLVPQISDKKWQRGEGCPQKGDVTTAATLLKKRLRHMCFPVDFVKFLRTPFQIEHLWWLLLMFTLPNSLNICRRGQKKFCTPERIGVYD